MNNGSLCSLVGSCAPVCGESVQLDCMNFKQSSCNLIYMDKVFSLNEKDTSPVTYAITADTTLTNQLFTAGGQTGCGCGCGNSCDNGCGNSCENNCCCGCCNPCSDFTLTAGTTFNVNNVSVTVNSLTVPTATALTAADVTVNGYAVDSLTYENGQYLATINTNIDEILNCSCIQSGNPTMAFFMASNANGWEAQLSIQVDGTVTNGSTTCCFRMCFETPAATPIAITGTSTFAIPNTSIPCSVNGVSPVLRFRFGGCGTVLNPAITVAVVDGELAAQLTGTLIVEPSILLEVTRPTMFKINAAETAQICDQAANCCSCSGQAELNCEGVFGSSNCGCGCQDSDPMKSSCGCGCSESESSCGCGCTNSESSCGCGCGNSESSCGCGCGNSDCFQCNGSNGYRW